MNKYKYIHRFRDSKGVYFILSNKTSKPNRRKAKFNPFGDVPTKYLKIISRDKINDSILRPMDEWVDRYYDDSRDMFYEPTEEATIEEMSRLMQKKGTHFMNVNGTVVKIINE